MASAQGALRPRRPQCVRAVPFDGGYSPAVVLAPWHVLRPRLHPIGGQAVTLVEAGGGYGKTSLARELAAARGATLVEVRFEPGDAEPPDAVARLAAAVRASDIPTASRLADVATRETGELGDLVVASLMALPVDQRVLVLLDDVQHLGERAARALATIATTIGAPHTVVVAGRHLAAPLLALTPTGRAHVGSTALALTTAEAAAVVEQGWQVTIDAPTRASLVAACEGWPAAVVLVAPRLASTERLLAPAVAARSGALSNLLEDLLAPLDAADLAALAQSARLPLLGQALDRPLGRPGLFERSRTAGLPYHPSGDGWFDLPDAVREHLGHGATADAGRLAAVADTYVRRGRPEDGVRALLDAGQAAAAADLLAGLPAARVDRLDLADLQALVDRLPTGEVDRRPTILLHLARACIPAAALPRRRDALARARAIADDGSADARAIDAELAIDLARDGEPEAASAIAARLLAEAGADEVLTRARAFDILGRALAWHSDRDADLRSAGEQFRTAAALAASADVPGITAEVHLALGVMVEQPLGRFDAAVEAMDHALAEVPDRLRRRATIQTFRADVLHSLGSYDEAGAALDEAAELAELLGDDRLAAYAAWEAAKGAARRGEHDRTLALLAEVQRHQGPWFEHPTGMVFLADAAECCDLVGEREAATAYLVRAAERMQILLGEDDVSVWMAKAACAARSGDPVDALAALDVVDRLAGLAPKDRWRPLALRAYATARRGDRPTASALAHAALDAATALGAPFLPDVVEPTIAAALHELAAAVAVPDGARRRVEVLGHFNVRSADDEPLDVPAGLPGQLVKLLAVHGGRLHQDVVTDHLWPDGDLAGASQRLRNVLHRLRTLELVSRDGEHLVLTDARIDVVELERLAARALAAPDGSGAVLARQALALHSGPLLPDDLYADWTISAREHVRRTHLDLLDLLIADAERRGATDAALDLLEQAMRADPDGESRAVAAARLHAAAGNAAAALSVLDRVRVALDELGVEPSPEHRELRRALQAPRR